MAELFNDINLILKAISDVLTAGVAIIAFSLFINSLTFKNRDAVTNAFTVLLISVMVIFGTEAFFAAMMTLLEPGDEVLIPNPGFISYQAVTQIAGAVPKYYAAFVAAQVVDSFRMQALPSPAEESAGQ